MAVLNELEPKEVFRFFKEISAIPRGSRDTKRISDYLVAFAKERDLKVIQDEVNNVIIFQPGTPGYEESEPVILQGHMDMVCEKTSDSTHDFKNDGLELYVEDGFLKAKDTTLGGDDGMALALMDSEDIPHPPIEAVFTVDEELGMEGAEAIDLSVLKGKKLINLDSEEEKTLTVGCAGGVRYQGLIPVEKETASGDEIKITIQGLLGGHSGAEIHKQRGNGHKMMGRLLNHVSSETDIRLISIAGGTKNNVISSECKAEILVAKEDADKVKASVAELKATWDKEFLGKEPGLTVDVEEESVSGVAVMNAESTKRVITYFVICPNGVQCYDRELEGLVETSLNLGIVETTKDAVKLESLVRSSMESKKADMKEILDTCAQAVGANGKVQGGYPAWEYKVDSELRKVMVETFVEQYGKEPVVSTIHAGLECGLFLGKKPDLDCVSMGPDLLDIHSFNEKLDIASTQRTWEYLKGVLAKLK
mgnify:CR=1 FL=1